MSCFYPSCMSGGGSCSYYSECEKESQAKSKAQEKQKKLDHQEQMLRIKALKAIAKRLRQK